MPAEHVVNVDLLDVRNADGKYVGTLAWGDDVEVRARTSSQVEIRFTTFSRGREGPEAAVESGFVRRRAGRRETLADKASNRVLKLDYVDVQQGDGSVIETPRGQVVLVDGGDNVLFARYLAARFRGTSREAPRDVDCLLVTHGDADHFAGLEKIHESEQHDRPAKRLFLRPHRVYHNGLVKRPDRVPDAGRLGPTAKVGAKTVLTGLETDLLGVPDAQMNKHFRAWKRALRDYHARRPIEFRRLQLGDDDAFDFLRDEGVRVEVLGPIPTHADGVTGLEFFGEPKTPARIGHPTVRPDSRFAGLSSSHTINGHSIVFRLTYGGWRFLYAGDLNEQSSIGLADAHRARRLNLRSEVFKVPHHGAADFSERFFRAVSPLVSIVSSGDESAQKEYIHPRATLMSALGRFARSAEPLVFVTELVAFFDVVGSARAQKDGRFFFAFERTEFGLVKIRTDGARLFVWTNSGQVRLKEAYAYTLDGAKPVPAPVVRV